MKKLPTLHIVVEYFYPIMGGIETNILETYSVLVKKGWNVVVHTSRNTFTKKNSLPVRESIRGISVIRYNTSWYRFLPNIKVTTGDIICLHNFNIIPHGFILLKSLFLKLLKKKNYAIVLTPHGGFTPDWTRFTVLRRLVKKIYHYIFGTFLINSTIDAVRAVSEWDSQKLQKRGINKELLVTISNGIEKEAYMNVDKKASKEIIKKSKQFGEYIIQIGRIAKIKNFETTIKALALISSRINFVVVGPIEDSKYYNELVSLVKQHHLENRVFFTGVVRGVDKYFLIKRAKLMVHMAKWESFCNAVHEGLSQGLICIVANNTALPFLVKDNVNGYCVDTFDHKMLAEKISFVIKNYDTRLLVNMRVRNEKYGKETSWVKIAEKMNLLYKNLSIKFII